MPLCWPIPSAAAVSSPDRNLRFFLPCSAGPVPPAAWAACTLVGVAPAQAVYPEETGCTAFVGVAAAAAVVVAAEPAGVELHSAAEGARPAAAAAGVTCGSRQTASAVHNCSAVAKQLPRLSWQSYR